MYFYINWFFFLTRESELADLAEHIQQKLSYFNELETINTVGALYLFVKLVISYFIFPFVVVFKHMKWYLNLIAGHWGGFWFKYGYTVISLEFSLCNSNRIS